MNEMLRAFASRTSLLLLILLFALCLGGGQAMLSGCTHSSILNPLWRDLSISLTGHDCCVDDYMGLHIFDSSHRLSSVIILDPLWSGSETVSVKRAYPGNGAYVDYYDDTNGNRIYNGLPADQAWRMTIPPSGVLNAAYTTQFTDISAPPLIPLGGDFKITLDGFSGDDAIMLRVEDGAGHGVGQYELGPGHAADPELTIPGIIVTGEQYTIDLFDDKNGNQAYDPPPVDEAWRLTGTGTATGLSVSFTHNTQYTDIGW